MTLSFSLDSGERKDGGDRQREQQGFGWFGQSLEDGVYEVDDDEEEMGQQPEAVDDDPFRRQQAAQVGDEEVVEEIDIDGEKYSAPTKAPRRTEAMWFAEGQKQSCGVATAP